MGETKRENGSEIPGARGLKNVRVSLRVFSPLKLDKPRNSFEQMELMGVARKGKKIRSGKIGFRRL